MSGYDGVADWNARPSGLPPDDDPSIGVKLLRIVGAVVLGAPGMMLIISGPIVLAEGNPLLGIVLFVAGVALMAGGFRVFRGPKDRTPMNMRPYG